MFVLLHKIESKRIMGGDHHITRRRIWARLAIVNIGLILVGFLFLPYSHPTKRQMRRNTAIVQYRRCYALEIADSTLLYFRDLKDGLGATRIDLKSDSSVCRKTFLQGCWVNKYTLWPHCGGRILTANPDGDSLNAQYLQHVNDTIKAFITQQKKALQQKDSLLSIKKHELNYFLEVHNATDAGYNVIASYAAEVVEESAKVSMALLRLNNLPKEYNARVRLIQHFSLLTINDVNDMRLTRCQLLSTDEKGDLCTIQTINHKKPKGKWAAYRQTIPDSVLSDIRRYGAWPIEESEFFEGHTTNGKRTGHGILWSNDGKYYNGLWDNDMRNGFGCAVAADGKVRVGEWKDDVFLGERPVYTSDHVYGIDISRYQHDIGKHHYAIDWDKLRITHLGTISNKKINGTVDYPISFCYIKSTEGATVRNRYFAADYKAARQHGLACGAYHFFSTSSTAAQQAQHFLRNTTFTSGDLAPVLDVEPSTQQISAMGGSKAMWEQIRIWMNLVEKAVGVKPILYISQSFVNRHLSEAPDIKRNYPVWIARYGEYKPDIKLVIWQLCPDGRVNGIHGTVDINLFNGYRDQYEDFLSTCRVP